MNWLVCWYVAISVNTECPDFKPNVYTGTMPSGHCAVYHAKLEKQAITKWFGTRIEADDFIKAAPENIKKRMVIINATDKSEAETAPSIFSLPN